MRIALYEPEIPQNTGTLLRTAACLRFGVDIIEPCGFPISDRRLKRAGMDYIDHVDYTLHPSYANFLEQRSPGRLIYLTPSSSTIYTAFTFRSTDTLLLGREADGIPQEIAADIPQHLSIPMAPPCRSLNVAIAGAIVMAHMRHQLEEDQ